MSLVNPLQPQLEFLCLLIAHHSLFLPVDC